MISAGPLVDHWCILHPIRCSVKLASPDPPWLHLQFESHYIQGFTELSYLIEKKHTQAKQTMAAQLANLSPANGLQCSWQSKGSSSRTEKPITEVPGHKEYGRRKSFMMDTIQSSVRRMSCTPKPPSKQSSFGAASVSSVTLSLDDVEPPVVGFSNTRSPSSLSAGSGVSRLTGHSRPSTSDPLAGEYEDHTSNPLPALHETSPREFLKVPLRSRHKGEP